MDFLHSAHSYLRIVILVFALAAIGLSLMPALRRRTLPAAAALAYRVYVWTLSLQVVIGLVVLISRWGTFGDGLRHRMEHATIMLIAVGISHWGLRFAKRADALGSRNTLFVTIATTILIVLGILILPQGSYLLGL